MILRTFKDDLAWSQKRMKIASSVVKNLFKQIPEVFDEDEQLLIYPVEGAEGELLKQLDKGTGIDYIISNKNGDKTICFSWRAVNSTPERCRQEGVYNAFSLRKRRNNALSKKENCEIEKRKFALKHGLMSPQYAVEAYFIDDALLSAAIARTEDVISAYDNGPVRNCNPGGKDKEVFFYDVSWEIMKENGYTVYDWYLNDKCKRTYRLEEYHKLVS